LERTFERCSGEKAKWPDFSSPPAMKTVRTSLFRPALLLMHFRAPDHRAIVAQLP